MFVQDLLDVNPTTLDNNNQKYDIKQHMPFPTVEFIRQETGIDMVEKSGEDEAKATIRYLTKLTRNLIMSSLIYESRNVLEFLIAKYEPYRRGFVDTVASVISTARYEGLQEIMKSGKLGEQDLPKIVQASAEANGLLIKRYSEKIPDENIREDY